MSLLMHFLEKKSPVGAPAQKDADQKHSWNPFKHADGQATSNLLTTYTSTAYQTESWGMEAAAWIMIRG